MSLPTVREVWRLALPTGTALVAGAAGLGAQVQWAQRMATRPPAFADLEPGGMAFFSLAVMHQVDDHLTARRIVESLADAKAAAVGVVGALDAEARAAAEHLGLALLEVPGATARPLCSLCTTGQAKVGAVCL